MVVSLSIAPAICGNALTSASLSSSIWTSPATRNRNNKVRASRAWWSKQGLENCVATLYTDHGGVRRQGLASASQPLPWVSMREPCPLLGWGCWRWPVRAGEAVDENGRPQSGAPARPVLIGRSETMEFVLSALTDAEAVFFRRDYPALVAAFESESRAARCETCDIT